MDKKISEFIEITDVGDNAVIPVVQGNPLDNYKISVANLLKLVPNLNKEYLSKINDDTAEGFIEFLKGISVEELATFVQGLEVGNYAPGMLGSGAALKMNNGISELEVDKLTVRMIATFFEIVVSKLRHINGGIVLSRGSMTCSRVVEGVDYYQCFFERGNNNEVTNTFVVNDQARCQVFRGGNQKFYWRLVTEVGEDWIKLSKTVGIGDSIPEVGDDIVQLGYQGKDLNHVKRLNAQIIDESGISQYVEIDDFTLEGKRKNFISADGSGSQFTGKVSFLKDGEEYDLSDWISETEENIDGAGNKTYFAKPTEYRRGDRWILTEDTQLLDNFYLKGQILEAVYNTGEDSDWRLMLIEGDEEATEGINLIRNYDFREGFAHWGNIEGSIVELNDELPTEFYVPSINVIGDEYGYEYAITSENDELIIFDE